MLEAGERAHELGLYWQVHTLGLKCNNPSGGYMDARYNTPSRVSIEFVSKLA